MSETSNTSGGGGVLAISGDGAVSQPPLVCLSPTEPDSNSAPPIPGAYSINGDTSEHVRSGRFTNGSNLMDSGQVDYAGRGFESDRAANGVGANQDINRATNLAVLVKGHESELVDDHYQVHHERGELVVDDHRDSIDLSQDYLLHCHQPRHTASNMARNQLLIVSILCFLFMVAEIVGKVQPRSLPLSLHCAKKPLSTR